MKLIKIIFTLIILFVIGGVAYLAITDVPVKQTETVKPLTGSSNAE